MQPSLQRILVNVLIRPALAGVRDFETGRGLGHVRKEIQQYQKLPVSQFEAVNRANNFFSLTPVLSFCIIIFGQNLLY